MTAPSDHATGQVLDQADPDDLQRAEFQTRAALKALMANLTPYVSEDTVNQVQQVVAKWDQAITSGHQQAATAYLMEIMALLTEEETIRSALDGMSLADLQDLFNAMPESFKILREEYGTMDNESIEMRGMAFIVLGMTLIAIAFFLSLTKADNMITAGIMIGGAGLTARGTTLVGRAQAYESHILTLLRIVRADYLPDMQQYELKGYLEHLAALFKYKEG